MSDVFGGAAPSIEIDNESVRRDTSPDRISVLVDAAVRMSVLADRLRLEASAAIIATLVANGASAVGLKALWDIAATPTAGGILQQWAFTASGGASTPAMQLRNLNGNSWILEVLDTSGNVKAALSADITSIGSQLNLNSAEARINCGAAGAATGFLRLMATELAIGSAPTHDFPGVVYKTNRTGGSLVQGDLVRLDAANDQSVVATSAQNQTGLLVVNTGGANLAQVSVVVGFQGVVKCTTAAVAARDYLRSSATAGQAETVATPVIGQTVGIACAAKGAGSAGLVSFLPCSGGL